MLRLARRNTTRYFERLNVKHLESATHIDDKDEVWNKHRLFCEEHEIYTAWSMFMLLVTSYAVVYDPYELAFLKEESENWQVDIFLTCCFLCDIIINFNTAPYNMQTDNFLIDRAAIAKQYVTGWLWVDVVSTIPWDEIFKLLAASMKHADENSDQGVQTISRGVRLLRLLRLLRVFRYYKLRKFLINVEEKLQINLYVTSLARSVLIILYMAHLLACLWYLAALQGAEMGYEHVWLDTVETHIAETSPYLESIFWSINILFVNIMHPPCNPLEFVMCIAMLLIGAFVFGFIFSTVNDLVKQVSVESSDVSLQPPSTLSVLPTACPSTLTVVYSRSRTLEVYRTHSPSTLTLISRLLNCGVYRVSTRQ